MIELYGLDEALETLNPEVFDKAIIATANEIIGQGFNRTKKSITSKFNIKISTVKDIDGKGSRGEFAFQSKSTGKINQRQGHIYVSKANKSKRIFDVQLRGSAPNLYLFNDSIDTQIRIASTPKAKIRAIKNSRKLSTTEKRQVRVKVLNHGRSTPLKHAFLAKMKSGHIGIFQRFPKGKAIFERRIHSPATMFNQQVFEEHVKSAVDTGFNKRFQHNWKHYYGK